MTTIPYFNLYYSIFFVLLLIQILLLFSKEKMAVVLSTLVIVANCLLEFYLGILSDLYLMPKNLSFFITIANGILWLLILVKQQIRFRKK